MISRLTTTLLVSLFLAALFAASALAQTRGMSGARASHAGPAFRSNGKGRLIRPVRHHSYGGFLFYPYYDYESGTTEEPPVNMVGPRPENPPVTVASPPAESLLLENRMGQWVRIPTGSHVPIDQSNATEMQASSPGQVNAALKEPSQPPTKLPPAVLVFRDGHQEEVEKYVVQGNVLYASADYWSTGSWTRKIPIDALDVPESVKLNATRGGNFSLPTRSNEVVVRF
jgi:hypothetical protein